MLHVSDGIVDFMIYHRSHSVYVLRWTPCRFCRDTLLRVRDAIHLVFLWFNRSNWTQHEV